MGECVSFGISSSDRTSGAAAEANVVNLGAWLAGLGALLMNHERREVAA